jgi:BirA family transcriptional regulator, biotin operon repressor / biotin---[acetyl-CoA-carboxylase] ligase
LYKIHPKTLFIGQKIYYLPSCQSTNDEAAQRQATGDAPEGTVVVTDRQTAGRGQRGNVWEAEPGQNLTFSVVLKPAFLAPAAQFRLNMAVSLGLYDALAPLLGDELRIKWPNDLYVRDRKIGGLLIENTVQGSSIVFSVAGVGLNVNQTVFQHPAATSMLVETPLTAGYDLPGLLTLLLERLEKRYLQLRAVHWTAVRADYLAVLYRHQTWAEFAAMPETAAGADEQRFTGRIVGVDEAGRLQIETPEGSLRSFWFKEVTFI